MPYTDFTLESAEAAFGLSTEPGDLFPGLEPLPVPGWLRPAVASHTPCRTSHLKDSQRRTTGIGARRVTHTGCRT